MGSLEELGPTKNYDVMNFIDELHQATLHAKPPRARAHVCTCTLTCTLFRSLKHKSICPEYLTVKITGFERKLVVYRARDVYNTHTFNFWGFFTR